MKIQSCKTYNIANMITKFAIFFQNILTKINLLGYGLCSIIIYEKGNKNLEGVLLNSGFKIFRIPQH